jgi:hypothetical protein
MKTGLYIVAIACMALAVMAMPVAAISAESEAAAAQVTVTDVTLDPQVFIEGDTGTISVEITNNGVQGVAIRRATLYDEDIILLSNPYDTATSIGGGNNLKFIFTVLADVPEGIYYPTFSIDFRDAGYLRYPVKLQVQNDPLEISILDKPDTFSAGKKDQVEILVGNPRDNQVNGVIVSLKGEGIDVMPSSYFIGNLDPDSSQKVTFSVTPEESTTLTVFVEYKNGINSHTESRDIPLVIGESKKQANPILSNIVVTYEGGVYTITGDVTNAGLEVANSVVISAGEGGEPVDPYRQYVVGSLQPDDFSSFEITFSAEDTDTIQILTSYKDSDGNRFVIRTPAEIPAASSTGQKEPGIPLPVIAVVVILVIAVGGIIWYSWRSK